MEARKVGVLCEYETRWKGNKAKYFGRGCKLLRSGANEQEWNGVGIILSKELKEDQISMSRKSVRAMSIELGLEEMVAYAPQRGCIQNEKETFW